MGRSGRSDMLLTQIFQQRRPTLIYQTSYVWHFPFCIVRSGLMARTYIAGDTQPEFPFVSGFKLSQAESSFSLPNRRIVCPI